MINKITTDELEYFDSRRKSYSDDDLVISSTWVDGKELLSRAWAQNKGVLYKLFGEELILSKEIELIADESTLIADMMEKWNDENSATAKFYYAIAHEVESSHLASLNNDNDTLYYAIFGLMNPETFVRNKVDSVKNTCATGKLPGGNEVSIVAGAKVIKILGKIAKAYDILDEFEAFRLEHSMILNQKKLTGKLCLSIHPLDFSTMSDNDNDWSSCMSWEDYGEYRQGTVEMMNSPNVICAYLEYRHRRIDTDDWNSKKWRELFVVDEELIAGIKGYPYQCPQLEVQVIDWLRELAVKNWGIEFGAPAERKVGYNTRFEFSTDIMYNDFRSRNNEHTHLIAERADADPDTQYNINYSGESQCMWCGATDVDFDHEGCLNCDDCSCTHYYCDDCGERLYEDDIYHLDEHKYCSYCYEHHAITNIFTEETEDRDNAIFVYVVPADSTLEQRKIFYNHYDNSVRFPVFGCGWRHVDLDAIRSYSKYQALFSGPIEREEVVYNSNFGWSTTYWYIEADKLNEEFFEDEVITELTNIYSLEELNEKFNFLLGVRV